MKKATMLLLVCGLMTAAGSQDLDAHVRLFHRTRGPVRVVSVRPSVIPQYYNGYYDNQYDHYNYRYSHGRIVREIRRNERRIWRLERRINRLMGHGYGYSPYRRYYHQDRLQALRWEIVSLQRRNDYLRSLLGYRW